MAPYTVLAPGEVKRKPRPLDQTASLHQVLARFWATVLPAASEGVGLASRGTTVATLLAMADSRVEIEIDFQEISTVWAMNNR
jgi:hypothetical protein